MGGTAATAALVFGTFGYGEAVPDCVETKPDGVSFEKWIKERKLTPSEELGDLCQSVDLRFALEELNDQSF
jgi:hypothetical protein